MGQKDCGPSQGSVRKAKFGNVKITKIEKSKNQKKTKIENTIEALAPLVSELDHVFDEYYH